MLWMLVEMVQEICAPGAGEGWQAMSEQFDLAFLALCLTGRVPPDHPAVQMIEEALDAAFERGKQIGREEKTK